jgi:hypothetical protein
MRDIINALYTSAILHKISKYSWERKCDVDPRTGLDAVVKGKISAEWNFIITEPTHI